ncbi:MAG: MarC family protein [Candidatus Micrarchaeia archaeon]|jgi:multiple antibiotic resistance protein
MTLEHVFRAAVVLFLMMDPFASLPVFLTMLRHIPAREKAFAANKAALVAGVTLIVFTIIGPTFLSLIGVSMASFMVGGGILLLLMSIAMVMGITFGENREEKMDVAIVLIAVPLITGPGAMTTATILAATYGMYDVLLAIVLATAAMWIVLKCADAIYRFIGPSGNEVLSRISGLLLAAIAVEFIRNGWGV